MSTWYPEYLRACFERPANSNLSGTLMVQLLSSSYTFNAFNAFLSDITAGQRVNAPVSMSSKTYTTGTFSAANVIFPTMTSGAFVTGLALYLSGATEAASRLVMYLNTAAVFPLTGAGVDQTLVWTPQPIANTTSTSKWYPNFAETLFTWAAGNQSLSGSDVVNGTVKALLVNTSNYTYATTDTFISDIATNARVGAPQTIGSKTFASGTFDGADITFPSLTGATSSALVIYLSGSSEPASRLMLYLGSAQGLPVTPNGVNQPVVWNSAGIAAIGATA